MRHLIALILLFALPGGAAAADAEERILGRPDAPGTIIEYASLTCPHCRHFHVEILPQLKREHIDTGRAKLIFRDFPLDRLALAAAMVARCAPEGRSLEAVDRLFEAQPEWSRADDPVGALIAVVEPLGMSAPEVERCLRDEGVARATLEQAKAGQESYAIDSTPTFIVNGEKIVGAQDVAEFEKALAAPAK